MWKDTPGRLPARMKDVKRHGPLQCRDRKGLLSINGDGPLDPTWKPISLDPLPYTHTLTNPRELAGLNVERKTMNISEEIGRTGSCSWSLRQNTKDSERKKKKREVGA